MRHPAVVLLLGVVLLAGLAVAGAGPAHAEPIPLPAVPAAPPTTEVPDSGARPPGAATVPSATPAPTPGPALGRPSYDDDPAWYDIGGQVRTAVVDLVVWAAEQALQPVLEALGNSWLSTPDLTGNEHVRAFWTTSLIAANGVFVLFIVANGFLVTTRETLQTRHGLKQVLPRIAVGAVLANSSMIIGQKAIEATNALTVALAGNSVDGPAAATAIRQITDDALRGQGFLMVLLVIAVVVMCLLLEFTFVLRLAALVILLGIAPAALICHASPLTEGLAQLWWRAFLACLGLQLAQAVVVMATVKVFLTPAGPTVLGVPSTGNGLLGVVVCLTMLWLLIKLPGWMRQFVLGPLGQSNGRGLLRQLVRAFVMTKTLGAAAGILGRTTPSSPTAGRTLPRPPGSRPSPGGFRPSRPPRPPRPGSTPRPPSPAGPVAFSHAPVPHTPLPAPAGTNAAPTFSHPPDPTTPTAAPSGVVPPVRFSHPASPQSSPPSPTLPPARVAFSDATTTTARTAANSPAPVVTFSSAPTPQTAPRRPPGPVTPVFSAPAADGPRASTPRTRPTAARRVTPSGSAAASPAAPSTARRASSASPNRPRRPASSAPPSPDGGGAAVPAPSRPSPAGGATAAGAGARP
ncbi:hypothetical protein [Micromonospora humidisoli]|uniref:hypothetical protein n=1 Tax=Micromonospora humidisoli TaxID=2807622 RepID=UPI001EF44334|nr:hypothetical protein [Micromonospora humidisoli]